MDLPMFLQFSIICLVVPVVSSSTREASESDQLQNVVNMTSNLISLNCTMLDLTTNQSWSNSINIPFTHDSLQCLCIVSMTFNISCDLKPYLVDNSETSEDIKITCRVYDWKSMFCFWDDSPTWTLIYSRCYGCDGKSNFKWCPSLNGSSCSWGENFFNGDCAMALYDTSLKALVSNSFIRFSTYYIAQPESVEDLIFNLTSCCSIYVTWKSPKSPTKYDPVRFLCRTILQSHNDYRIVNTTSEFVVFENLYPYTNYIATVDCIPLIDSHVRGFWSETRTISLQTYPDVPSTTPAVAVGGFRVSRLNDSSDAVTIFWQPVDEPNGPVTGFRVRYRSCSRNVENEIIAGYQSNATLQLDSDSDYVVRVDARTVAGFNESLKPKKKKVPTATLR